ncbi:hypothetical protein ACOBQX_15620 [Actinokineospora sp. G85]|uniref:hypothetical protein n=1 Tax=Actinokineospora sp. G85 TaxID=3406626 RepID=UPI003C748FBF
MADGAGGSVPVAPDFAGTRTLNIEPAAIPAALAAFREAYDRVETKVTQLSGLEVPDWARDPISGEAATEFVDRTNGGGADSAITCLRGYQEQLRAAVEALEGAHAAYEQTEGTNSAMWGKRDQG